MPPDPVGARPELPPNTLRPFRISDAMILLAAIFVALTWDRDRMLDPTRWISNLTPGPSTFLGRLAIAAVNVFEFLPPFLSVWGVTVLGLRLRRPRPPLRQLARQPGAIACAVSSLVVMPATLAILASHYLTLGSLTNAWARTVADLRPENLRGLSTMIGIGVMVTWLVLMSKQRWRPEPSWIDRLGRLIGVGWIAMIFGGMLLPLISIARML